MRERSLQVRGRVPPRRRRVARERVVVVEDDGTLVVVEDDGTLVVVEDDGTLVVVVVRCLAPALGTTLAPALGVSARVRRRARRRRTTTKGGRALQTGERPIAGTAQRTGVVAMRLERLAPRARVVVPADEHAVVAQVERGAGAALEGPRARVVGHGATHARGCREEDKKAGRGRGLSLRVFYFRCHPL